MESNSGVDDGYPEIVKEYRKQTLVSHRSTRRNFGEWDTIAKDSTKDKWVESYNAARAFFALHGTD